MNTELVIEHLKKQVWDLTTELRVEKARLEGVIEDMNEIKKGMSDGFKDISNKIIVAMSFIISILLTCLGVLIYNFVVLK